MSKFIGNAEIKAFLESRVNLPRDKAQDYRDQVNRLRERLKKHISENPGFALVKMLHSGSVAKGTALKTVNDLDVAVYVREEDSPTVDADLIPWFAQRLREANPQLKPDQFEENQHSVTVNYRGSGLDVDVVPVLYDGGDDDRGFLIHRQTGEHILTSIPLHLEFIRKRKEDHPKHYSAVVRLVKWWVKQLKDVDPDFRCKSFLIELLVAHLADDGLDLSDYPEALNEIFTYVVKTGLGKRIAFTDYYSRSELPESAEGSIQVFDPVNPENNICQLYSIEDRDRLVQAAEDAADAIDEANYSDTKGRAVERWQSVFGSSFRGQS